MAIYQINVTENILKHLSLRDAVRTSVLSSRWRYKWVTLPQLAISIALFPLDANVKQHEKDKDSELVKFFHSLPAIENLYLDSNILKLLDRIKDPLAGSRDIDAVAARSYFDFCSFARDLRCCSSSLV
ncbi:unnamed protein product [Camellia sinensis]